MIKRLIRRLLDEPTPEDGLAETLAITIRCARRCAYDLSHAADMIPYEPGHFFAPWHKRMQDKASHWQSLFSSGASMKDYRLKLHQEIDRQEEVIRKLRLKLVECGQSEWLDDEVPF